ncbi:hypothetical protein GCM10023189_43120 [Nibrella saemangeumensis]|uniref:Uncharacterized protein n=1 Tax=Nibrella saemangeumensis TaxID=1084526 RepID=A0ABP8NAP5_9BACT
MNTVKNFLLDELEDAVVIKRELEDGKQNPISNYIACVMVERDLITLGESFTPSGGGQPVLVDASNIVDLLVGLTFEGKAYFFGNGTVNGSKARPEEMMESQAYGSYTEPRPTGHVKELIEFTYKNSFLNTPFLNALRRRTKKFDVFVFTDTTVQQIRYRRNQPIFKGIGSALTGNALEEVTGGFQISYNDEKGELEPWVGINEDDLDAERIAYTFGAYGAPTGLTAVAGAEGRYTMVTGTGGHFTRTVEQAAGSPVYSIFKDGNKAIPNAEPVTVDSNTGKVTVGNTLPVGRYTYTVVAENATGVRGKYTFTIHVNPA